MILMNLVRTATVAAKPSIATNRLTVSETSPWASVAPEAAWPSIAHSIQAVSRAATDSPGAPGPEADAVVRARVGNVAPNGSARTTSLCVAPFKAVSAKLGY